MTDVSGHPRSTIVTGGKLPVGTNPRNALGGNTLGQMMKAALGKYAGSYRSDDSVKLTAEDASALGIPTKAQREAAATKK